MRSEADNEAAGPPFQICGSCGRSWNQWAHFILDPGVRLIGFQAIPGLPDANLLVFEHRCGSSISVLVKRLRHLLGNAGAVPALENLFGTETCHGHCRFIDDLQSCDRPCVNARDRKLILMLLEMKKSVSA